MPGFGVSRQPLSPHSPDIKMKQLASLAMAEVTELLESHLSDAKIKTITGRDNLENVASLEMKVDTRKTSLAGLGKSLPSLERLRLNDSFVPVLRDIGSGYKNLRILWMSRCQLTELDGLGSLSLLKELYISFNAISDLSSVSMMECLEVLDLEGNQIQDYEQIEHLALCEKLRSLTLEGNPLTGLLENSGDEEVPGFSDERHKYRMTIWNILPSLNSLDEIELTDSERKREHGLKSISPTTPYRPASALANLRPITIDTSVTINSLMQPKQGDELIAGNPIRFLLSRRQKRDPNALSRPSSALAQTPTKLDEKEPSTTTTKPGGTLLPEILTPQPPPSKPTTQRKPSGRRIQSFPTDKNVTPQPPPTSIPHTSATTTTARRRAVTLKSPEPGSILLSSAILPSSTQSGMKFPGSNFRRLDFESFFEPERPNMRQQTGNRIIMPEQDQDASQQLLCYCRTTWEGSGRRFMLRCDACKEWFHGDCLTPQVTKEQAGLFIKFHCPECEVINGPSTVRPPPIVRPKRDSRALIDYNELNRGGAEDERKFAKMLAGKRFAPNKLPYMNGDEVTMDWIRSTGLREPFIVEDPDGLDMKMPTPTLTVDDVADACGRGRIVEAMEVATQQDRQMTLQEWATYFGTPESQRKKIMNVISLEISESALAPQIVRPRIVRELDWTEKVWPSRSEREEFPKVQLYCLMSVKDCYTDFHIDFGATSVFYHLLSGAKIFYFVRPTETNLKKYEKWSSSPDQSRIFFGDEVKECIAVRIEPGNTMIIPSGWIHSVYTPKDSIVIGGNFLHGFGISTQLKVYDIENKTGVPPKFRFPFFVQMQWYAARYYLGILRTAPESLSKWEFDGLKTLAQFLTGQVQILSESAEPREKRMARLNVPDGIANVKKLVRNLSNQIVKVETKSLAVKLEQSMQSLKNGSSQSVDQPRPVQRIKIKLDEPAEGEQTSLDIDVESTSDWENDETENEFLVGLNNDSASDIFESEEEGQPRKKRKHFKDVEGWEDDENDQDYSDEPQNNSTTTPYETNNQPSIVNDLSQQQTQPLTYIPIVKPTPVIKPNSLSASTVKKAPVTVFGRLSKAIRKLSQKK